MEQMSRLRQHRSATFDRRVRSLLVDSTSAASELPEHPLARNVASIGALILSIGVLNQDPPKKKKN